jgi:hypothetical protein
VGRAAIDTRSDKYPGRPLWDYDFIDLMEISALAAEFSLSGVDVEPEVIKTGAYLARLGYRLLEFITADRPSKIWPLNLPIHD